MANYASGSFLTTWNWGGAAKAQPAVAPKAPKISSEQVLEPRATRGPKLTEAQKAAFFEEMGRNGGNATQAALKLGISGGHGRKLALKAARAQEFGDMQDQLVQVWLDSEQDAIAQEQEAIEEDLIEAAHAVNVSARAAVEAAMDKIEDDEELVVAMAPKEKELRLIRERIKDGSGKNPLRITTRPFATHFIIPDVQMKPKNCVKFLRRVGLQIVALLPDVIVCIGDWADMPSLSTHDRGRRKAGGRTYDADVKASRDAMEALLGPIKEENARRAAAGLPLYEPEMIMTLGNHEFRIEREVDAEMRLEGTLTIADLEFEKDWRVYPFLEVVRVDGVCYSHYFASGPMGRPVSSAKALIQKKHESCVMGHVQGDQIASEYTASGQRITGLFVGCCYEHDEDYLGSQGNNYFRGVWVLHEVNNGEFYPQQISLDALKRKYP